MTGRINAFHDAVVSKIKAAVPGVVSVERQFGRFNLDELDRNSIRCPAIRFAALTAKVPSAASGQQSGNLSCAAFAVVGGTDREEKAWALAEAVATLAHSSQMWGLTRIGVPDKVAIQPVISAAIKDRGIVIIAVEWNQDIRQLGEDIFAEAGRRLEELFINGEEIELQAVGGDDVQP